MDIGYLNSQCLFAVHTPMTDVKWIISIIIPQFKHFILINHLCTPSHHVKPYICADYSIIHNFHTKKIVDRNSSCEILQMFTKIGLVST